MGTRDQFQTPINGVGLGLRSAHIQAILSQDADIGWFELLSDNWINASGLDGVLLNECTRRYPVALHSVNMNIAGCDPIDEEYIHNIKKLAFRTGSQLISDHMCFSSVNGRPLHDLAPIPYHQSSLKHVCSRVHHIQEILGQSISIENISAYIHCLDSTMSEAMFFNEVASSTGCTVLVDVNNLFVNEVNLGRQAKAFLKEINPNVVSQFHLGGYHNKSNFLLDAHDHQISEPVLILYREALKLMGLRPTLIEWDHDLPSFEDLMVEYHKVSEIYNHVMDGQGDVRQVNYA